MRAATIEQVHAALAEASAERQLLVGMLDLMYQGLLVRLEKPEAGELEAVLYKIDDYDVARVISRVDADLDHADEMGRAARTDYVLITLIRTMRESGASAEKSLAPLVARVDAAKQDSREQAAAMVALYNAAASNAALCTAGVEPTAPDSPMPLTPSTLFGVGVTISTRSYDGSSAAEGNA